MKKITNLKCLSWQCCRLDRNFDLVLQSVKVFPVTWCTFLRLGEISGCVKCVRVSRINYCRRWRDDGNDKSQILKLKHSSTDMASLWLFLRRECPIVTKMATEALHPFSTSYLCEAGFSAMNTMKGMNRSRLQTLEEDLRVRLSTIQPQAKDIMRRHQARVSHW
jgi:hypothetical protein